MAKITLSKQEQQTLALAALIGIVVLYVYAAYIVGPLWGKLGKLGQDIKAARAQVQGLEQVAANETAIRQQHTELNETVASLRNVLPGEEALPQVIEFLSDLASQTQVKIQTIFPQRSLEEAVDAKKPAQGPSEPLVYKRIPIQLDASAGYHQLGAFLNLIERAGRGVQITSLRISLNNREPKRHDIRMVFLGHFAILQPESRAAGRQPYARLP